MSARCDVYRYPKDIDLHAALEGGVGDQAGARGRAVEIRVRPGCATTERSDWQLPRKSSRRSFRWPDNLQPHGESGPAAVVGGFPGEWSRPCASMRRSMCPSTTPSKPEAAPQLLDPARSLMAVELIEVEYAIANHPTLKKRFCRPERQMSGCRSIRRLDRGEDGERRAAAASALYTAPIGRWRRRLPLDARQ